MEALREVSGAHRNLALAWWKHVDVGPYPPALVCSDPLLRRSRFEAAWRRSLDQDTPWNSTDVGLAGRPLETETVAWWCVSRSLLATKFGSQNSSEIRVTTPWARRQNGRRQTAWYNVLDDPGTVMVLQFVCNSHHTPNDPKKSHLLLPGISPSSEPNNQDGSLPCQEGQTTTNRPAPMSRKSATHG